MEQPPAPASAAPCVQVFSADAATLIECFSVRNNSSAATLALLYGAQALRALDLPEQSVLIDERPSAGRYALWSVNSRDRQAHLMYAGQVSPEATERRRASSRRKRAPSTPPYTPPTPSTPLYTPPDTPLMRASDIALDTDSGHESDAAQYNAFGTPPPSTPPLDAPRVSALGRVRRLASPRSEREAGRARARDLRSKWTADMRYALYRAWVAHNNVIDAILPAVRAVRVVSHDALASWIRRNIAVPLLYERSARNTRVIDRDLRVRNVRDGCAHCDPMAVQSVPDDNAPCAWHAIHEARCPARCPGHGHFGENVAHATEHYVLPMAALLLDAAILLAHHDMLLLEPLLCAQREWHARIAMLLVHAGNHNDVLLHAQQLAHLSKHPLPIQPSGE